MASAPRRCTDTCARWARSLKIHRSCESREGACCSLRVGTALRARGDHPRIELTRTQHRACYSRLGVRPRKATCRNSMGRGPALNRCGAGSNPAATTPSWVRSSLRCSSAACRILTPCGEGSSPPGSLVKTFVGLMCRYIAAAVNRRSEGSSPPLRPCVHLADPSGERDSLLVRRDAFDSRGQLELMARVLLVRRSGFHPGLAGIVTPARHPGSLAVLVKAAA